MGLPQKTDVFLFVSDLPDGPPSLSSVLPAYQMHQDVFFQCVSLRSSIPSNITFYINNEPVSIGLFKFFLQFFFCIQFLGRFEMFMSNRSFYLCTNFSYIWDKTTFFVNSCGRKVDLIGYTDKIERKLAWSDLENTMKKNTSIS